MRGGLVNSRRLAPVQNLTAAYSPAAGGEKQIPSRARKTRPSLARTLAPFLVHGTPESKRRKTSARRWCYGLPCGKNLTRPSLDVGFPAGFELCAGRPSQALSSEWAGGDDSPLVCLWQIGQAGRRQDPRMAMSKLKKTLLGLAFAQAGCLACGLWIQDRFLLSAADWRGDQGTSAAAAADGRV